jgi:hypothetical protein
MGFSYTHAGVTFCWYSNHHFTSGYLFPHMSPRITTVSKWMGKTSYRSSNYVTYWQTCQYASQKGDCWTCCRSPTDDVTSQKEVVTVEEHAFSNKNSVSDVSISINVNTATSSAKQNICLLICLPEAPQCPDGWVYKNTLINKCSLLTFLAVRKSKGRLLDLLQEPRWRSCPPREA